MSFDLPDALDDTLEDDQSELLNLWAAGTSGTLTAYYYSIES